MKMNIMLEWVNTICEGAFVFQCTCSLMRNYIICKGVSVFKPLLWIIHITMEEVVKICFRAQTARPSELRSQCSLPKSVLRGC